MIIDYKSGEGIEVSSIGIRDFDIQPYLDYLNIGYAADMNYLSRKDSIMKRESPYLIAGWAKSIIVLKILYKFENGKVQPPYARFAMYSMLRDYHRILKEYIENFLTEYGLFLNKKMIYVDTGPIMEREIGRVAGLGWIGKNSMLINRRLGSYTFLGEALVDIKLDRNLEITPDMCGKCDLCIRSCPVNAIDNNRKVDSNKCISYHTIETRKVIPMEIGRKMENMVFGCDICNDVCPWNKSKKGLTIFENRKKEFENLKVEDLVYIDEENFLEKFGDTPIKRAKIQGVRRNAVMAHFNIFNDDRFLERVSRDFQDLGGQQANEILNNLKK